MGSSGFLDVSDSFGGGPIGLSLMTDSAAIPDAPLLRN
jgi:hypothetical protein